MSWWQRMTDEFHKVVSGRERVLSGNRGNILDKWELQRLFEDCCENAAPAVLLCSEHADVAFQGRFAEVTNESVTLDLVVERDSETSGRPISNGAMCSVAMTYEQRSYIFMAQVQNYIPVQRDPADLPKVVVAFPALIAASESRMSFRVPVSGDVEGLKVTIHSDQGVFAATPLDLSLTGMLFSLGDDAPGLKSDERIGVEMTLKGEVIRLAAVAVPRSQAALYGAYFPEVLRGANVAPPQQLREVLSHLEREWLVKKVSE